MKKNKKRGGLLIGTAVVFVVLILGVVFLGEKGFFGEKEKNIGDDISSKDAVTQVAEADETMSEGTALPEEVLVTTADYADIYEQLVTYYKGMYSDEIFSNPDYDFLGGDEVDLGDGFYDVGYDMSSWISFTEVQEHKEVGDVCKNDDDCAYLVRNDGSLRIMQLDGSSMVHESLISDYLEESAMGMYIRGNKLVRITCYTEILDENTGMYQDSTRICTYDISNRETPVLTGTVEMEGFYLGSYMTDTEVYVYTTCNKSGFTDENNELIPFDSLDPSEYVPSVNGSVLAPENVYMAKKVTESSYLVCGSVNIDTPDQISDAKAFLSIDTQYYTGTEGIYVSYKNGLYDIKNTVLVRIDMTEGMIRPAAGYIVEGIVTGTAAMYERDGLYYVIASAERDGKNQNDLYILDGQMQLTGKMEDITDSAEIQAVRYVGKRAFLATNGEKPITVINLNNSEAISVNTSAQPDYFSNMLCEFGEDQVLSISYDVDHETGMSSRIHLTMFDVSDSSNIKELHNFVVEADSTPAVSSINGLYVDVASGLIGFPTEDWDEGYENVENYYHVFSYSADTGFQNVLKTRLGAGTCWRARGFAMGDSFYVAENDTGNIRSYNMTNSYEQTGEMYY